MTAAFRIERLEAHDRSSFACEEAALDRYFREQVTQDIRRRLCNGFVAVAGDGAVAGFYTFAATSLPLTELPEKEARRLPRYPLVPAALIGRLAVDHRFHGQGLGGALIFDAVRRAAQADPAIFALLVDAKSDAVAGFYRHLGFHSFASRPGSLWLPMAAALKAIDP